MDYRPDNPELYEGYVYSASGNLATQEMTVQICGKEIGFIWDAKSQEWVGKEFMELQETAHLAVQLWAFIGLGAGVITGMIIGFALCWAFR